MKRFFYLSSLLLHPLWIPTWILCLWFGTFLSARFGFFGSTFGLFLGYELFFVALIPILISFSSRLGQKTDWEMENVTSRVWPFLIGGIFWLGYTVNLRSELGEMANLIWFTTGSGGILLLILSFCYYKGFKVSAHASGWALLIPIFIFNKSLPHELRLVLLMGSIFICGIVTGVRWISGAHQLEELIIGLFLGIFISTSFLQTVSML